VLREARHEAGLVQTELARRLKKPPSYVAKVEIGERGIDPIECIAWAKACRLDPETLFSRLVRSLDHKF
jgi:transcriptional regulator with XRE-family HTH domain